MRFLSAILILLLAFSSLSGETGAGSPVYGMTKQVPGFSHLRHEHSACEHCHPGVAKSSSSQALVLPGHDVCGRCHEETEEEGESGENCGHCHTGRPEAGSHMDRVPAKLKFSHMLHSGTPESCMTCHVAESEDDPDGLLPDARTCATCHSDMMEDRCDACHVTHSGGRLVTDLPGGKLVPTGSHGGDAHGTGWQEGHGRVARRRQARCLVCHEERHCDQCHRGVHRPLRIHPADWELSHPGPARAGVMDCDSCHRSQSSCLACHRKAGMAQSSEKRPVNIRLHPAGYDKTHSVDARRNIKACTACHTEGDCISCHGARGIGQGISPHPKGFRSRCRLMLNRNPRPCYKCHLEGDMEVMCR